MPNIILLIRYLIQQIIDLDKQAPLLPQLSHLLIISKPLLAISYFEKPLTLDYIFTISIFMRPQKILRLLIPSYVFIIFNSLYLIAIFIPFKGRIAFAVYGQLFRTGFLNFLIEITYQLPYFSHSYFILIAIIQQFILMKSLDVECRNLQKLKINIYDHLIWILNLLQSLLWYYKGNLNLQFTVALASSIVYFKTSDNFISKSISLFSILITLNEKIKLFEEFSSGLLIFPLILKVFHHLSKYPKKQQSNISLDEEDKLIQASLFIKQKQYLIAIQQIQALKSTLGFIEEIHRQELETKCLRLIYVNIISNSIPSQSIINVSRQIVREDNKYRYQIELLSNIMKKKLELLKQLQHNVFTQYFKYFRQLTKLSQNYKNLYQEMPNKRYKTLLLFFLFEIENNFYEAKQLFVENKQIKDEDLQIGKIGFIVCYYDKEIQIKHISNNEFFSKSIHSRIEAYIPPGVREQHYKIVNNLLTYGASRYYQSPQLAYYVNEDDKIMNPIDFYLSIQCNPDLQFLLFFQPTDEEPMALLLNQAFQISCVTEKFLNKLGLQVQDFRFFDCHICRILPQFNESILTYENTELFLSDDLSETPFVCSFDVHTMHLHYTQPLFYKLIFGNIKQYRQKSLTQFPNTICEATINHNQSIQKLEILPEDSVIAPYDNDQYESNMKNKLSNEDQIIIDSPKGENNQLLKMQQKRVSRVKVQKTKHHHQKQIKKKEDMIEESESKKQQYLTYYYQQQHQTPKLASLTLILSLIFTFMFTLIILIMLQYQLKSQVNDINILEFAQSCLQPVGLLQLAQFSLTNYAILYQSKQINQSEYMKLITFPKNSFENGFYIVKKNIDEIFNEKVFSPVLDNNNIEISQYSSTLTNQSYDVSLRGSLIILLNFQYSVLLQYKSKGFVNIDTPEMYYTFKNFLPLQQSVQEYNGNLLDSTIHISYQASVNYLVLFLVGILCFSLPFTFSYVIILKIIRNIKKNHKLLNHVSSEEKNKEISRLSNNICLLEQNYQFLINYSSNLSISEPKIDKKLEQDYNPISHIYVSSGFFIIYILMIAKFIIQFYFTANFLRGYQDIAKFYYNLSQLSTDIVSMYACREVLYNSKQIPFLLTIEVSNLFLITEVGLAHTKQYLDNSELTNKKIITEDYRNYYNSIMSGDICEYLSDQIKNQSTYVCPLVLGGNMQNGLIPALTYLYHSLITEKLTNNFTSRPTILKYDLEGPGFIVDILSNLTIKLKNNLENITDFFLNIMTITNTIVLILISLIIIIIKFFVYDYLSEILYLSRRFITFIPIKLILYDEVLDRKLRKMIYLNGIS